MQDQDKSNYSNFIKECYVKITCKKTTKMFACGETFVIDKLNQSYVKIF